MIRLSAVWGVALAIALGLGTVARSQEPGLASFYVKRDHFSDAIGTGYDEYLDVVPQGAGLRVRLIRVSSEGMDCDGSVVEATERIVPGATVASFAGSNLCALTQKQVDTAARRAKIRGLTIFASEYDTIMAACGAREHVVELPVRAGVDSTIDRRDPAVTSAFRLFDRLRDRAFDANAHLDQSTGTALVPYLRSGRFAAVAPQAFAGYLGPRRSPVAPALLERDTLPLDVYREPTYPPIAWSARVAGDVRLHLRVSPSGEVTDVQVVKSIPLLDKAAADAARAWKFTPRPPAGDQVDVTVRFQHGCR